MSFRWSSGILSKPFHSSTYARRSARDPRTTSRAAARVRQVLLPDLRVLLEAEELVRARVDEAERREVAVGDERGYVAEDLGLGGEHLRRVLIRPRPPRRRRREPADASTPVAVDASRGVADASTRRTLRVADASRRAAPRVSDASTRPGRGDASRRDPAAARRPSSARRRDAHELRTRRGLDRQGLFLLAPGWLFLGRPASAKASRPRRRGPRVVAGVAASAPRSHGPPL